jgi:hypothetical protein
MLAKLNLTINQDKEYNREYKFDIDEIDNIKVWVSIKHKDYLRIEAINIYSCGNEGCRDNITLYCQKILENGEKTYTDTHLDKIIDILNNLKFNKLKGKFYLNNDRHDTTIEDLEERKEFHKKLNSNIKVKKMYEDCTICFEPTMCKTMCGHFCCYPCLDKIDDYYCDDCKENEGECDCDDDEDVCGFQRCPVCRQKMYVIYHI